MSILEAIKAVREACKRMEVRYTPSAGEYIYGSADALAAIAAAEAEAEKQDAAYQRARDDWAILDSDNNADTLEDTFGDLVARLAAAHRLRLYFKGAE